MVGNLRVSWTAFGEESAAPESSWKGKFQHKSLSSYIPMIGWLCDKSDSYRGGSRTSIIDNQEESEGSSGAARLMERLPEKWGPPRFGCQT